jgi:CubicO group peptidase (beta-lactamase class C family)
VHRAPSKMIGSATTFGAYAASKDWRYALNAAVDMEQLSMKPRLLLNRRSVMLGMGAIAVTSQQLVTQSPTSGVWSLTLHTEDVVGPLRFRFEIFEDGSGLFTSIDQPVRRKKPLKMRTKIRGNRVDFEVPDVSVKFSGRLNAADKIEGEFDYPTEGGERDVILTRGEVTKPAPPARSFDSARLETLRSEMNIAGLAVAVAQQGQLPRLWIAGERKRGSGVQLTGQDVFQYASCSKSFTATLIARLVEQGAMNWSDTIGDVLGNSVPSMVSQYRQATILHLLSHRAGMPRDNPNRILKRIGYDDSSAPKDRIELARHGLSEAPIASLGSADYRYSNVGYTVAAAMVEARTGNSFEALMRAEVFEPLGLRSAVFRGALHDPPKEKRLAQPLGHPNAFDGGSATNPAGGVAMTLSDMLTYLTAHRDRSAFLKAESWRRLHADPFGELYALGWHLEDIEGGGHIHGGAFPGWLAKIMFNKQSGSIAVAVMNDRPRRGEALLTQCIYEALV